MVRIRTWRNSGIACVARLPVSTDGRGVRLIRLAQAPPKGTGIRREQGDVLLNSRPSISSDGKVLLGWVCTCMEELLVLGSLF